MNPSSQAYIQRSITAEAVKAAGFQPGGWQARLFGGLMAVSTRRFARLAAGFDERATSGGLPAAARWVLPRLASQVACHRSELVPEAGPLVIASNHPGAFDGLVILAHLNRPDVKLIVSDVPVTRGLSATAQHLIYSSLIDGPERLAALREALRHLKHGGALLLFPTGVVDPDPAFMPGAAQALHDWSPSLEFFLAKAPETRLQPVIVSGVLAPRFMNHFLARRQQTVRARQKVAEYLEIATLLLFNRDLELSPHLSFGQPLTSAELNPGSLPGAFMPAVISAAERLLADHLQPPPG